MVKQRHLKNKVEVLTVRLFSIHLPLKLKQQILKKNYELIT